MSSPRASGASDGSGVPLDHGGKGKGKGGFAIDVTRRGDTVSLSLTASDEYAAIELYEHFVLALQKGHLNLELH